MLKSFDTQISDPRCLPGYLAGHLDICPVKYCNGNGLSRWGQMAGRISASTPDIRQISGRYPGRISAIKCKQYKDLTGQISRYPAKTQSGSI